MQQASGRAYTTNFLFSAKPNEPFMDAAFMDEAFMDEAFMKGAYSNGMWLEKR